MRRISAVAVLVAGSLAAMGQGAPGTRPAPAVGGPFPNQYQQMMRSLKLTDPQKATFKEQIDVMNRELERFRQEAVKKSRAAITVIESKDGPARDKLREELATEQKKLSDEYQALISKHQNAINAGLTTEQRLAWETFLLNRAIQPRIGMDLTDSQRKQVRQLIDTAAKELAEAKDTASVLAINGRLVRKLVTSVLTEEQAARLFSAGPPALTGLGTIPGPKATPIDRNLP